MSDHQNPPASIEQPVAGIASFGNAAVAVEEAAALPDFCLPADDAVVPQAFLESDIAHVDEVLDMMFLETPEEAAAYLRARLSAEGIAIEEPATEKGGVSRPSLRRGAIAAAGDSLPGVSGRMGARSSARVVASERLSETALKRQKMAKLIYYGVGIAILISMYIVGMLVLNGRG